MSEQAGLVRGQSEERIEAAACDRSPTREVGASPTRDLLREPGFGVSPRHQSVVGATKRWVPVFSRPLRLSSRVR
jgi:hypothetical protein